MMEDHIAAIELGLFPSSKLLVSLHKIVSPSSDTTDTNSINPHSIVQALDTLPSNQRHEKFSLMDASRIMSLDHIAVAANSALIRQLHFESYAQDNDSNTEEKAVKSRGLALETVVCAAGSTNVGSIMKDYAFDAKWNAANNSEGRDFHVLLFGYNVTKEEHLKTITKVGLNNPESTEYMMEHFHRSRSDEEVKSLIKVYKIGKEEVSNEGSSLEKAILNRVATKFYT